MDPVIDVDAPFRIEAELPPADPAGRERVGNAPIAWPSSSSNQVMAHSHQLSDQTDATLQVDPPVETNSQLVPPGLGLGSAEQTAPAPKMPTTIGPDTTPAPQAITGQQLEMESKLGEPV